MNAVAGGGTLVTFGALLLFGTSPRLANGTSTVALLFGLAGSLYGFRQHLNWVKEWLARFAIVSLIGGLAGAWLLTVTSDKMFARLVPFLILFATIIFVGQGAVRRMGTLEAGSLHAAKTSAIRAAILFQFLVSVYGGYFGAGIGILMLASLGFLGLTDIHEMNTLKTILASLINVVAAIWFIKAGFVDWPRAAVMTAGAMGGYYAGSHLSQRISQERVRQLITVIGFILAAATFYQEFLR